MIQSYATREEWLAARGETIGGSEAPIITLSAPHTFGTLLSLYTDKTTPAPPNEEEAEYLELGREIEEPIARIVGRKSQRNVIDLGPFTTVRSDTHPWMGCTPDRVVIDPEKGVGVLQIKNVAGYSPYRWDNGVPEHVLVQNHHELAVCRDSEEFVRRFGRPTFGMCAALIGGGRVVWQDSDPNERFIVALIEREAAFIELIRTLTPPEPSGWPEDTAAIARLYSRDDGTTVELGTEAIHLAAAWERAKNRQKRWLQLADLRSQQIRMMMGDAALARLPDGTGFSLLMVDEAMVTPKPYLRKAYRTLRRRKKV